MVELGLTFYFLYGASLAFRYHDFSMFPYHLMLSFGFGMISWFTLKEQYGQGFIRKFLKAFSYRVFHPAQAQ